MFAVTAWRYLDQLAVSMRPATVDVADNTLRCFAGFLVAEHPELGGFVDVRRVHVEGFKLFFVAHITAAGKPPARNTIRQRFGMLRSFFDRIIEWDWDDAPMRIPIFSVDVPIADDPLPTLPRRRPSRPARRRSRGRSAVRSARHRAAVTHRDARR